VAEFVGVMNRLPGQLQGTENVRVLDVTVPVKSQSSLDGRAGEQVDVLVRPEGLTVEVTENGNGIVTTRTFLGSVTRIGVLLSGDVTVQVDKPSVVAAAIPPGTSVSVTLPAEPVLVAPR
jgi:putative spermidine/putrescine transport system ATP-binding protein